MAKMKWGMAVITVTVVNGTESKLNADVVMHRLPHVIAWHGARTHK